MVYDRIATRWRLSQILRVLRQMPHCTWWVALGSGDAQGLTLGGQWRPWADAEEYADWRAWQHGGGNARALYRLRARRPSVPWLWSITTPFWQELSVGNLPRDWVAFDSLRWTMRWPWNPDRQRWEDPAPSRRGLALSSRGAMRGFGPWAAVLTPGEPWDLARWYDAGLATGAPDVPALPVPWFWVVLTETLMLQAIGAGFWDVAEVPDHAIASV